VLRYWRKIRGRYSSSGSGLPSRANRPVWVVVNVTVLPLWLTIVMPGAVQGFAVPPVQLQGIGYDRCPGESCEQARPRRIQDLWAAMAIPFPVSVGLWYDLPQMSRGIGPDAG